MGEQGRSAVKDAPMKLTDIKCKNAKPKERPWKLADSNGLYLEIMPNGAKYWRQKYRIAGKEKRLALGIYPLVGLLDARKAREEARQLLQNGADPGVVKQTQKQQARLKTENSFESVALEWHANRTNAWTPRYANIVLKRLELDVLPFLGAQPIDGITAPELLIVVRKIEGRGAHDLAHRVVQVCGQIFRYAIVTGRASRDVSADLRGALTPTKKKHHAHLSAVELPEFISKLEDYDGGQQTKLAIKLLMLTFVRTVELRGAEWSEIDFEKAEWRIPAERMKMRQPHIVPLSKQSLEVLGQLKEMSGGHNFVFPGSNNPRKCMSENTILYALYRMGYHSRATGHGFRATASTILNENGFRSDVIEAQLAHIEGNKSRASYNHAEYLAERKIMMQQWADYLDAQASGGKVIIGKFA